MISSRQLEMTLWMSAAAITGAAVVHARAAAEISASAVRPAIEASPAARTWQRSEIERAREAIVSRNPFRIDRKPSIVAFGAPALPYAGGFVPTKPPNPALKVSGIIGGPPWAAVVEGMPGRDGGVLVRSGDVIGAFSVRSVTRDSVVIAGMDTTWRLTVRRAW